MSVAEEKLLIRSDLPQIAEARRWFTAHVRDAHCDDSAIREMETALGEALANVVRHAYRDQPSQPIDITLTIDSEKISLVVCDQGEAFAGRPQQPGSYGLILMERLTDEMHRYVTARGDNCLRMVKHSY